MALWRKWLRPGKLDPDEPDPDNFDPERWAPVRIAGSQSYLDESRADDRISLHKTLMRWILAFAVIFAFAAMVFWWSGSAIRYSAARVQNRSNPTYRITGTIFDARTHQPIPWAEIATDFRFGGAFFSATSGQDGQYSINTLAEPHDLVIRANGYKSTRLHIGKQWYTWMPNGNEKCDVELTPD